MTTAISPGVPSGSNGTTPVASVGLPSGVVGLSPDMILAYCGTMLNNLNGQIDDLMGQQERQITEQNVLSNLQTQLSAYSPPSQSDLAAVQQDFQSAIAQLPPGSEAATQLQAQLESFEKACNIPSTPPGDAQIAQTIANNLLSGSPMQAVANLTQGTAPSSDQWQSITSGVGNISNDVKSNSQIQFLQLQDLCSQQQDAVEQATNMMSKEDQTLLDQAKAAGS
jgi:hypothetical protein